MIDGSWDIAMIVWGVVWVLGGAGLLYGVLQAVAAEDRAVEEAQRAAQPEKRVDAEERPKAGVA